MDCEWHSGAWIDVLNLLVPSDIPEAEHNEYRVQLENYLDRCAMVLESWDRRDAHTLGDFQWSWVDYERQIASLSIEVEGFRDLRLFVWVNDFAYATLRTIYVVAANGDGQTYLEEDGMSVILRRRGDIIAQLTRGEH